MLAMPTYAGFSSRSSSVSRSYSKPMSTTKKVMIGAGVLGGAYLLHRSISANKPSTVYCNSNDRLLHIHRNTDRIYLDNTNNSVPCNP